jgi:hypothetical protein
MKNLFEVMSKEMVLQYTRILRYDADNFLERLR